MILAVFTLKFGCADRLTSHGLRALSKIQENTPKFTTRMSDAA